MIYSYKRDGIHFELIRPQQLEEPRRNIFSSDSFTLVVGHNGTGKTHFLSGLANEVLRKKSNNIVRRENDSGQEVIVFYTSSPFQGIRPKPNKRVRRLGPNSPKVSPSEDLLNSISAAFSASGVAELRLASDQKSGLRALAGGLFEIPVKLRGKMVESIRHKLSEYQKISSSWVRHTANEEVESAIGAKSEMISLQRDIHEGARLYLQKTLKGHDYRLNLHALDLAIKRNRRKRNKLIQDFLDNVEGRAWEGLELLQAMEDVDRAVAEHGKRLLTGGTVKIDEKTANSLRNKAGDALVFAMAGASSGQSALFDQFAKIDKEVQALSGAGKDLLLMIDEGDAFLHFSWQQKYVKFLDAFVARVRSGFASVQVVLTTHSPILMSDVPSDNVVRLDESNVNVCTFGAPLERIIRTTLGAGSIGDFSADKIGAMIERTAYADSYLISQIDDGFIKEELRRVVWA